MFLNLRQLTQHQNTSTTSGFSLSLSRVSSWASSTTGILFGNAENANPQTQSPSYAPYYLLQQQQHSQQTSNLQSEPFTDALEDSESGVAFFNDGDDPLYYTPVCDDSGCSGSSSFSSNSNDKKGKCLRKHPPKIDFTKKLPLELSELVMKHLTIRELCICAAVSSGWKQVAESDTVWRYKYTTKSKYWRTKHKNFTNPNTPSHTDNVEQKPQHTLQHSESISSYAQTSVALNPNSFLPNFSLNSPPCPTFPISKDQPLTWKGLYATRHVLDSRWVSGKVTANALSGHKDSVYCAHYNDSVIVTASRDHTIKIWNAQNGALIKTLGGRGTQQIGAENNNEPATVNANGAANATAAQTTQDPPANIGRNLNEPATMFTYDDLVHTGSVVSVQFDDKLMVSGSSDNTFIIWDFKTLQGIMKVSHHTGGILDIVINSKYIVTGSKDSTICVWDRTKCELGNPVLPLVCQLRGHRGPVNAIQIKGDFIVSAAGDGLVKLWSITGEEMPFMKDQDVDTPNTDDAVEFIRRDASFPDNKTEEEGIMEPEDVTIPPVNPKCLRNFRGHIRGLACVQIYPNCRTIISGGNDNTIRMWDVLSGRCVKILEGHRELVRSLDICNGRIVSASYDQTIKIWDAENGDLITDLSGFFGSWIFTARATAKRIVATSFGIKPVILEFGEGLDKRYLDFIL